MLAVPDPDTRPSERVSRIVGACLRSGQQDALKAALTLVSGETTDETRQLFNGLEPAWADFAIASVYAALLSKDRRKKLGAYFTPPGLVQYLLARVSEFGVDLSSQRIRDPAAGGAAFIVPIAREMVKLWRGEGLGDHSIVERLKKRLLGREIDPGLATLANALLRRCLIEEYGFKPSIVNDLQLISLGNTLTIVKDVGADHEIGNPPFLRLAAKSQPRGFKRFSDISAGRLNLYAVFVRRGVEALPAGGILAYIVPASFIGGPEFRKFRHRIRQLAEVLAVDTINGRSTVFANVVQDTCILVLRKRSVELQSVGAAWSSSRSLSGDGLYASEGNIQLPVGDAAWILPGIQSDLPSTLFEWGYAPRIGYLVANRQSDRIHERPAKGRVPLIWAKAIGQDGKFDFAKGARLRKHGWVQVPADAPYVAREACVAIQRTSSRGQKKRITAAEIPSEFIEKHGGVVAENHVILLLPTGPDATDPALLAKALNRDDVSAQMDRMCGSASIPARLLASVPLPLPPPAKRNKGRLG